MRVISALSRLLRCAVGPMAALLLMAGAAQAQTSVTLTPDTTDMSLLESLEYLPDHQREWSAQNLPPADAGWRPLREHPGAGNFGHLYHPMWLRATLDTALDRPSEWRWVVDHPVLSSIDLIVVDGGGRVQSRQRSGLQAVARGEAPAQRAPAMRLQLPARDSVQVLMRVETDGLLRVPVHLYTEAAWGEHDRWLHLVLGAYFGLITGLLAYNAVFWLRLHDTAYGYYVAFGLAIAVHQLGDTGLGAIYVWPAWALQSSRITVTSGALFATFALMFTNHFLRLSATAPRLSKLLRVSSLICLSSLLLIPYLHVGDFIRWVLLPMAMWSVSLLLLSGVVACWRKVPAAPIFLMGWSGLGVAAILRAAMVQGWVSADSLPYHALQIATAIELVLLSSALADRIRLDRRARSEAEVRSARERTARELAHQTLDERTRFMASVTHDLQQPLYALRMVSQSMLSRREGPTSPELLAQLASAVHATDELAGSMLMAVQLQRDELVPSTLDFCVQPMLERIEAIFCARAQERGLRWVVLPSLAVVHADPALLDRMVCNLVANALRYTERGGVMLSCRQRAGGVLIQIWDTGVGIAETEASTLFEPFRRGAAARPGDQGLGLGLSIVAQCARLLGITVGCRSRPGRGSCFSLTVPLAAGPSGHDGKRVEHCATPSPSPAFADD